MTLGSFVTCSDVPSKKRIVKLNRPRLSLPCGLDWAFNSTDYVVIIFWRFDNSLFSRLFCGNHSVEELKINVQTHPEMCGIS